MKRLQYGMLIISTLHQIPRSPAGKTNHSGNSAESETRVHLEHIYAESVVLTVSKTILLI